MNKWGVLQRRSDKCIDGPSERIMTVLPWSFWGPVVFQTRREAREWIKQHFGYVAKRNDLRESPHGWLVPIPVKIEIETRLAGDQT